MVVEADVVGVGDGDVGMVVAVVVVAVVVDTAVCLRFCCLRFLARLFWNQILICLSDNCNLLAISCFLGMAIYSFNLNSFSNSMRCVSL